jgi:hypothetical protein
MLTRGCGGWRLVPRRRRLGAGSAGSGIYNIGVLDITNSAIGGDPS